MVCADFCVVDNMVYMGTINNNNKTWQVVICAVYNKLEKVFKRPGDPEADTSCSCPLLNYTQKTLKLTLGVVVHC